MVLGILSDGSDGKDMISLISFYAGETLFGTTKQTNPVDAGGCHGERSTGRDVQVYNSQDPTRHKVLETPIRFDYIVFFFFNSTVNIEQDRTTKQANIFSSLRSQQFNAPKPLLRLLEAGFVAPNSSKPRTPHPVDQLSQSTEHHPV